MNPSTPAAARRGRGLYLVTPDRQDTSQLLRDVAPLLGSGVRWLQYRNKSASPALRHEQAQGLQALCARAGIPLIINDDPPLAADSGAAGVHLGEDDGEIAAARSLLGPDAIVGASCYDSLDTARDAVAAGASYVAFGAFFPTRSKQTTRTAARELLARAAPLGVARVAIGGITPDNAQALIEAGADMVAVIGGVFDARDPLAAVQAYARLFEVADAAAPQPRR